MTQEEHQNQAVLLYHGEETGPLLVLQVLRCKAFVSTVGAL